MGNAYFYAGRYDQAIAEYKRALELNPEFPMTLESLGRAYVAKGMYSQAIAEFSKADLRARIGYVYAISGDKAKAREILKELNDESKSSYVSPSSQALVLVGMGQNADAIFWLEKSEREHVALHHLNVDPEFFPLRPEPRFQELLQRIGLVR